MGSLHARHLLRPSLDDRCEEEELIENLSQQISKLISSAHRHIQFIRSSLGQGYLESTAMFYSQPNRVLTFIICIFRQQIGAKTYQECGYTPVIGFTGSDI